MRATIRDPSRIVNHLIPRSFEIANLQQSSLGLSNLQQSSLGLSKSPKTNTLPDRLIERTSSMLDETELKIMHKDDKGDR